MLFSFSRIASFGVACALVAFACDNHAPRDDDDDENAGAQATSGGGEASVGGSGGTGGEGAGGQAPAPSVCGNGVCEADEDCEPMNWLPEDNPCQGDCGLCPGWCVPTEQGGLTACNPFTFEMYNGDPCPGVCQWSLSSFQFYCTAEGSATQGLGDSCDLGVGGPYCAPGFACPDQELNVDDGEVCEQICCSNADCPVGSCGPSAVLGYVGVCQ